MEIKAFRGYRYDIAAAGSVGDCIAPPYDVIDAAMQQALYDKNPYNIVRITKGKIEPGDNGQTNQYTRAAGFFNEWLQKGVLKKDEKEAIYAYTQEFETGGVKHRRDGFVALGKLASFGSGVQPHEKTLDGPKADRLRLTIAAGAQFGQIFMLYDDPKKIADAVIDKTCGGKALIDFTDTDGVRHKLFTIEAAQDIEAIVKMMADKVTVIADGHHRYETALNYYNQTKKAGAQYVMATFVNMQSKGLVILPTHRLVSNLDGFDRDELADKVRPLFDVSEYSFTGAEDKTAARGKMFAAMRAGFEKNSSCFGIYAGTNKFYMLQLKSVSRMDSAAPQLSGAAKTLDVNILHKLILEDVLGIGDKALAGEKNIEYIKDIGDAIDRAAAEVDAGRSQIVFFMNPTRIEQVKAIAGANEKMPQKSTFFYPKVFTGLVINKF